ncbi:hypothetical protein HanIR_Chr07g0325071 [Helianthus annuus]|nr:hypothetical protein HanIR_Chr07g0325071 [Helianthus annuus]
MIATSKQNISFSLSLSDTHTRSKRDREREGARFPCTLRQPWILEYYNISSSCASSSNK